MQAHRPTTADRLVSWLAHHEQRLKWLALTLGLASTVAIVQNWHPWPMVLGLPFCVIWVFCAWLHTERQLRNVNLLFTPLCAHGLLGWFVLAA